MCSNGLALRNDTIAWFFSLFFFNDVARKLEEAHLLNHKKVVNVYNLVLFWSMLTV